MFFALADFGCGQLVYSVLKRSKQDVAKILEREPDSLYKKTTFGHSIIHLAVGWPEGLAYLLSNGGSQIQNTEDSRGSRPLSYACEMGCVRSAQLLLNKDCRIDDEPILRLLPMTNENEHRILRHASHALANRRRRLVELARKTLESKTLDDLRLPSNHVLDQSDAINLQDALYSSNVVITEALKHRVSKCWVYNWNPLRLSLFLAPEVASSNFECLDIFWKAGFRYNPDQIVRALFRSARVSLHRFLDTFIWFRDHGLSPSGNAYHEIATILLPRVCKLNEGFGAHRDLSDSRRRTEAFLDIFLSQKCADHQCLCSTEGCVAAAALISWKEVLNHGKTCLWAVHLAEAAFFSRHRSMIMSLPAVASQFNVPRGISPAFTDSLGRTQSSGCNCALCTARIIATGLIDKDTWNRLARGIIRAFAFEILGLTHSPTCCKARVRHPSDEHEDLWDTDTELDKEDIGEKQEEEDHLRCGLDPLVDELTVEYKKADVSLSQFLVDIADFRVRELLEHSEPVEEAKARLQQIGVKLDTI